MVIKQRLPSSPQVVVLSDVCFQSVVCTSSGQAFETIYKMSIWSFDKQGSTSKLVFHKLVQAGKENGS